MNKVYIVKEEIDTYDVIRAVFSDIVMAHKYRKECIEQLDEPDYDYRFKIECWQVDGVTA